MTKTLLVFPLALLGGCLSVDALPEFSPEPAFHGCIDRGRYELDGQIVEGLSATCDGDRVCIDGACVAEPRCQDADTACLFQIYLWGQGGVRSNVAALDDALYFVHSTAGEGHEDMPSGGLRRERPTWSSALLESELGISAANALQLRSQAGLLIADVFESDQETDHLVLSPVTVAAVDFRHLLYRTGQARPLCVSPEGTAFMNGGKLGLWSRHVVGPNRDYRVPTLQNCFVEDGVLWGQGENPEDELLRLDVETGELTRFMGIEQLVGVHEGAPIELRGSTLRVATATEGDTLVWRDVLTITSPRHGDIVFRGDEVTWAHAGTTRASNVILQSRFDATEPARVLAEMPRSLRSDETAALRLLDDGVLWELLTPHGLETSELHYVPLLHDEADGGTR